jgi:hypothetical protein
VVLAVVHDWGVVRNEGWCVCGGGGVRRHALGGGKGGV